MTDDTSTRGLDVFAPWPKIPRLRRNIIITEKIDGTNAQISIRPYPGQRDIQDDPRDIFVEDADGDCWFVRAGSRTRWLTTEHDNAGFFLWVHAYANLLVPLLGEGRHYGEWWGRKVQRTYNLDHNRFSLFNVTRWRTDITTPGPLEWDAKIAGINLDVVPVLAAGSWSDELVDGALTKLRNYGSVAAPGYDNPEGIVVFHAASRSTYKVLLENDDTPKGLVGAA